MKIFSVSAVLAVLAVVAAEGDAKHHLIGGNFRPINLHPKKAASHSRSTAQAEIYQQCTADENCPSDRFCFKGWCRIPPPPIPVISEDVKLEDGRLGPDGRLEDERYHGGRPTEETILLIQIIKKNIPHNVGERVHSCETTGCPQGQRCVGGKCDRRVVPYVNRPCTTCPPGQWCSPEGCSPNKPSGRK